MIMMNLKLLQTDRYMRTSNFCYFTAQKGATYQHGMRGEKMERGVLKIV